MKLALAFLWVAALAQPQPQPPLYYYNLDFETLVRGSFWFWVMDSPGYTYSPDMDIVHSGDRSLRLAANVTGDQAANSTGIALQQLPPELFRGHHVHMSGWIRTDSVSSGAAAIWFRVDGNDGVISLDNLTGLAPTGTTGWSQYAMDRDVSADCTSITMGTLLSGSGTAWFDGLSISIDGVDIPQAAPPLSGEPTPDQVSWLQSNAIPINGATPGQPYDDLMPLKQLIGDAKIVGLGEATHGTREFFQMKNRIVDFLAREMGFTVFSMEANMPEASYMNQYVLNGVGDPALDLQSLYFWTWNTQEVLDMVKSMREWNASSSGAGSPIQFTGFDMQYFTIAGQLVRNFLSQADAVYNQNVVAPLYSSIQNKFYGPSSFGVGSTNLPSVDVVRGKHLRYTGFIKTAGITSSYASLWMRADGLGKVLQLDTMTGRGAVGTIDWTLFTIEMDIPQETTNLVFGVFHPGNGTVWFDSLSLSVDGSPLTIPRIDLDFEASTLSEAGFGVYGGVNQDHVLQLDNMVSHTGKQSLRSRYTGSSTDFVQTTADIVTHMEQNRDRYLSQGYAADQIDWATQNARIVNQATTLQIDPSVRDADMAQNIDWIVDHSPPGTKIVLWAHDYHISRNDGAMGSFLAAKYGKDYLPIGFAFHDGDYNAFDTTSGVVVPNASTPSFPGSLEYMFLQAGYPYFALDLRLASPDNRASAWLLGDMQFRTIGSTPADGFYQERVSQHYDGMIFVKHSTPTTLLPF